MAARRKAKPTPREARRQDLPARPTLRLIFPPGELALPVMKIRLGLSPEADDVFMFHGLTAGHVDTGELEIEPVVEAFQTLNDQASRGQLEATSMSVHAYAYARKRYVLSRCGGSFGMDCGALLVAREEMDGEQLAAATIAVPGVTSSAYLAMALWGPSARTRVLPFDKIIPAVESGLADCGLISHEEQMSLEVTGLTCVLDLGVWWSGVTGGMPLPMGCVAIKRSVPDEVKRQLQAIIGQSVRYGLANRAEALAAVNDQAGGETGSTDEFIGRYVTDLSVDVGGRGQAAMEEFLKRGCIAGIIPDTLPLEFVPAG